MSLTFKHTGKCGDLIFALPMIQALGGGMLFIPEEAPEVPNLYSNMHELLTQQPYIKQLCQHPPCAKYETNPLGLLIDLDHHRQHKERGRVNMVQRYYDIFRFNAQIPDTWLTVEGPRAIKGNYTVVNITPRFRDHSKVNWERVIYKIEGPVVFIGTEEEASQLPCVRYVPTGDALELALLIKYADAVYCNQSFVYALAVAMGKKTFLEVKPGKTNCLGFKNVNVL